LRSSEAIASIGAEIFGWRFWWSRCEHNLHGYRAPLEPLLVRENGKA